MIEQQGQVVAISGQRAHVRIGGATGCPACDSGKGCGAGIFGRLLRRKPVTISLENEIGTQIGQAVVLGLPEAMYMRLLGKFYLFPMLGGVTGAAVGHYLSVALGLAEAATDGLTLIFAILTGVAIFVWGRARSVEFPQRIAVHLLRVSNGEDAGVCPSKTPATASADLT